MARINTFGKKVREVRNLAGMTISDLAKYSGYRNNRISNIECGVSYSRGLPMTMKIIESLTDDDELTAHMIGLAKSDFDARGGTMGSKGIDWHTGERPNIKKGLVKCCTCKKYFDKSFFIDAKGAKTKGCKLCLKKSRDYHNGVIRRNGHVCKCGEVAVEKHRDEWKCYDCYIGKLPELKVEDFIYNSDYDIMSRYANNDRIL